MSSARRSIKPVTATIAGAAALGCAILAALLAWPADPVLQTQVASIVIADRSDRLLYEAIDPSGSKHIPLPLSGIPMACQQATIATEDAHFYEHPGVDPLAIVRSAWLNWRAGTTVSGASTLTQQLARNLLLSAEERQHRSLARKLREAWLALRLERRYAKDELLALYLNTTYYGHFASGIEAAAQAYFGTSAPELDLAQCALLAGLAQSPAFYNPIENPEAAQERQAVVLRLMVEQGYITPAQAAEAGGEAMTYASTPFPIEAPHFVMWVLSELESLLPDQRVRLGGLRVTTTLDLDWQHVAEQAVRRRLAQLRPCTDAVNGAPGIDCALTAAPQRRVENAAVVALDPHDGAVLAMVGSPDYFDGATSGAVNASLSLRQPGSAIKPLTYAAALDPARSPHPWTAATVIADLRTAFTTAEGTPYVPQNYDRRHHGPVTVRAALANSYNIPAVKALAHVGVDALVETAASLGIPWNTGRWTPEGRPVAGQPGGSDADARPRFGLSLTLGGGEVRLLDLSAAYAALANGGHRVAPHAITRVETLDGAVLYDAASEPAEPIRAVDPRVAFLITDILSDNRARLPAFGANNVLEIGRPAAAKTGTTTDWRDNWTLGYTPELVAGVWVGNADGAPMEDVSGISGAGPIWHDFMTIVLKDVPPSTFPIPEGLVRVEVCADSGLLPGQAGTISADASTAGDAAVVAAPCPHRRLEWFIAGAEPDSTDEMHFRVALDVRTGQPASPATPPQYTESATLWQLPIEYHAWARENGMVVLDAAQLGARGGGRPTSFEGHDPAGALADASGALLTLLSPDPARAYRIDPGLPIDAQAFPVTALPRFQTDQAIILSVDDSPIARMHGPEYTVWWQLSKGTHTFQAIATGPDGAEITSPPVTITVE